MSGNILVTDRNLQRDAEKEQKDEEEVRRVAAHGDQHRGGGPVQSGCVRRRQAADTSPG